MNKDTIIGFVLIALVLIGFSWYKPQGSKTALLPSSRITLKKPPSRPRNPRPSRTRLWPK